MAIDYLQIFNLMTEDGDLWRKTRVACFKAAVDILSEAPETTNHANRTTWAQAVLLDPKTKSDEMKYHVLQNSTIQTVGNGATDNDVQFVVNGLIDTFATGA